MEIQREVRKFIAPVIHWLYVIEKTNIKKTWSIIIHKIEWCSKKGQWLRKTEKVENSGRIKPSSRQGRHGKELSVCVWGGGMQWEKIRSIPENLPREQQWKPFLSTVTKFNFTMKMFALVSLQSCSNHLRQVHLWRQKVHLGSQ